MPEHPLAREMWGPLRRSILTLAARNPTLGRKEIVCRAASAFFDDPTWRNLMAQEIQYPVFSSEEEVYDWVCELGYQVWEERHRGPLRIKVRVTRHKISIEGILPPLTDHGAEYYEQHLLHR